MVPLIPRPVRAGREKDIYVFLQAYQGLKVLRCSDEMAKEKANSALWRMSTMREQIFRVEYCDTGCPYAPGERACFMITPDGISVCARCKYQEIPDDNWVCDGCGMEFDRLEKYFEVATGPDIDEILKAPEIYPNVRAVPLVCRFKWFCRECYTKYKVGELGDLSI